MRTVVSFILLCMFSVNAHSAVEGFAIDISGKALNKMINDEIYALTNGAPINFPPLGKRVLATVSNGLVFINGEYMTPPHEIARDENTVCVDGFVVYTGEALPKGPRSTLKPTLPSQNPTGQQRGVLRSHLWTTAITPSRVIFDIERVAKQYLAGIESGGYLMLGEPMRSGDWQTFPQALFPLADALVIATNEAQFAAIMQTNMPPGGISGKGLANFWKHREQAPVWKAAAEAIVRRNGLSEDEFNRREEDDRRRKLEWEAEHDEFARAQREIRLMLDEPTRTVDRMISLCKVALAADALVVATNETGFLTLVRANMPSNGIPELRLKGFWEHRGQIDEWGPQVKKIVREWNEAVGEGEKIRILTEILRENDPLEALEEAAILRLLSEAQQSGTLSAAKAEAERIQILTERFRLSDEQFAEIDRALAESQSEDGFIDRVASRFPYMISKPELGLWRIKHPDQHRKFIGATRLMAYYRHPEKFRAKPEPSKEPIEW